MRRSLKQTKLKAAATKQGGFWWYGINEGCRYASKKSILLYFKQQQRCVSLIERLNWGFDNVPPTKNHEPCSASPQPTSSQNSRWMRFHALLCRNVTDKAWLGSSEQGRQSSQAIQPKSTITNKILLMQVGKDICMYVCSSGGVRSTSHMHALFHQT